MEEVNINPTIELPELTQDWRNTLLEVTNKGLCTPGPRRKEQCPHKGLTWNCSCVSRESPAEAWVGGGLVKGRGH